MCDRDITVHRQPGRSHGGDGSCPGAPSHHWGNLSGAASATQLNQECAEPSKPSPEAMSATWGAEGGKARPAATQT